MTPTEAYGQGTPGTPIPYVLQEAHLTMDQRKLRQLEKTNELLERLLTAMLDVRAALAHPPMIVTSETLMAKATKGKK
jgi:hypothetical protein